MLTGPACCAGGVCGYGSTESGVCFIGIAPGYDEWNVSHRPFTGRSGKLLDAVLKAVGLSKSNVYCTNLICWYKDKPTPQEISVCASRLERELALVQPKVLVLLGKLACESVLGIPFSKARGAVTRSATGQYTLVSYHPAAPLHTGKTSIEKELQLNAAYDLCRDLRKLPDILLGNYDELYTEPVYTLITTVTGAQALLDKLPGPPEHVALDIETDYDKESDKAHPFSDKITCIGIGWDHHHAYVLTQSALSPNLKWPKHVHFVYHNGAFDTQQIARHLGTWLPISDDTMLMSYSCDERSVRGLHKLKSLSREYCGAGFYEEDEHKLDSSDPESYTRLYKYNANDVVYTRRLFDKLRSWQQDEGTAGFYEGLLLPATEILARAQYRGIYVNPTAIKEMALKFGAEYIILHRELEALGINPNSPQQVAAQLVKLGATQVTTTSKPAMQDLLDNPNTPEPVITFIKKLLRHRTLAKLYTVYLEQTKAVIQYDGRVHPHAFLIGTSTGRLTYRDPPMQTLPKPANTKDLAVIRQIFTATNDDYILLEADYRQIEGWVGAYLCQDELLQQDLASGDWHAATATNVYGVSKSQVSAQEWSYWRGGAKHVNYGIFYDESPMGLTRKPPIGMGCDIQTAKAFHEKWYARYTNVVKWKREVKQRAQQEGIIETPFGRRRRFPLIVNDHQLRQAVNFPVQSTASDYTISSAIRLDPLLQQYDTHLLFIEHDALYYEVRKSHVSEVVELIEQVMTSPPLPGLPSIAVEIVLGPNLHQLGELSLLASGEEV